MYVCVKCGWLPFRRLPLCFCIIHYYMFVCLLVRYSFYSSTAAKASFAPPSPVLFVFRCRHVINVFFIFFICSPLFSSFFPLFFPCLRFSFFFFLPCFCAFFSLFYLVFTFFPLFSIFFSSIFPLFFPFSLFPLFPVFISLFTFSFCFPWQTWRPAT